MQVADPACNGTDDGTPNGRPDAEVYGCKIMGRLSRWSASGGSITGFEQVLLGETLIRSHCDVSGKILRDA